MVTNQIHVSEPLKRRIDLTDVKGLPRPSHYCHHGLNLHTRQHIPLFWVRERLPIDPGIWHRHNDVGNLAAPPELQRDLQSLTFCYKVLQPKPITGEET
jgi:hypothetical protein